MSEDLLEDGVIIKRTQDIARDVMKELEVRAECKNQPDRPVTPKEAVDALVFACEEVRDQVPLAIDERKKGELNDLTLRLWHLQDLARDALKLYCRSLQEETDGV